MNLPVFSPIPSNVIRSTYYTFSKALTDFDKSVSNDTTYYFTKMVALNLPIWTNSDNKLYFNFINTESTGITNSLYQYAHKGSPELSSGYQTTDDPNYVIPALLHYYTENIIRQSQLNDIDRIAELAFWKTIQVLLKNNDMTYVYNSIVTFINSVNVSNFIQIKNNHGWCELIGSVPNICNKLVVNDSMWKVADGMSSIGEITADSTNTDDQIYDKGSTYTFDFTGKKSVIDFDNITIDNTTQSSFDFNTLLLFYKDSTGVDKLHGVNFIYPFRQNSIGETSMQTLHHNTNIVQTFGYSFKFLMKTNATNQDSIDTVYQQNEGTFFQTFEDTLGAFKSFLEQQITEL